MRFVTSSVLFVSVMSVLAGCSDSSNNSSSTISNVEGWVGAQGFNNAQVVINQIAESGQVSVSTDGIYMGLRESTDALSRFTANVANDETLLYIARGQIADVDKDKDNLATLRQCQLAAKCTVDGIEYDFGAFYPAQTGFEWRSLAYTVSDGSRNNVNPLTTFAAAYAFQYDVLNYPDKGAFAENETYTAYDVVLANSQVSKLIGLDDIIGELPANLTRLNNFSENTSLVRNQIRYGALIASLQQSELSYRLTNNSPSDSDYITLVAEQFVEDVGQFYNHSPVVERALTLKMLYQGAFDNLTSLLSSVNNVQAKAAVSQVINDFESQIGVIDSQAADTKTTAIADDLSILLTASEVEEFNLGLEKTKLFVTSLLDYQQTFWQPEYKSELDTYLNFLKSIGDEHKDNLNALVAEFSHIQNYYVTCIIGGSECDTTYADLEARKTSYNATTKELKLDDNAVVVSQKIADLNLTDSIEEPSSSHAIDIFITGKLKKNNLVLTLAHDLDSNEEKIDVPSSMRIYYTEEVTAARPDLVINGYELIWGAFEIYDETKLATTAETELSGAFRIFYRGVQDPQNSNQPNDSELRFNIEDWVLSTTISDQVDDDADGGDRETSAIVVTASTSNPAEYYPATKIASFNGFFVGNDDHPMGEVVSDLLQYRIGQEDVPFGTAHITVETVDFINALDTDIRYRFYPDEKVEDTLDSDGDGDVKEIVDMHRIEECELDEVSGNVTKCGPKTKRFEKQDVQNTINELWELGLFQRTQVEGRGTYYVDFPVVDDANGCKVLDTLNNDQISMGGTLIEQQVLGLDSVRLFTEIQLEDENQVDLPKTLLDMSVIAPTSDKYRINVALSHNYTSTTSDTTGLILGVGTTASIVTIGYDTSSDFENAGNLTVSKAGVTLTLGDGTVVAEDQDVTAFLSQTYDPSTVHYKIIEDAEGNADRCVLTTGSNYVKNPDDLEQVFYLNYRDVVYGTVRPEGANNIWTIRYIDGTWMIPASNTSGS